MPSASGLAWGRYLHVETASEKTNLVNTARLAGAPLGWNFTSIDLGLQRLRSLSAQKPSRVQSSEPLALVPLTYRNHHDNQSIGI